MKKNLFIILLFLIPLCGFSQKKKSIDGFLDIPFGSDSATVKNMLLAKGAVKNDSLPGKGVLTFTGLNMDGKKVAYLFVRFVDNKIYEADFIFNDFAEKDILDYHDDLSNDISAVYGKGKGSNNFGNENDPVRIRRLKSGSAFSRDTWQSKNKNVIALTYLMANQTLQIDLIYQDTKLWNINEAKIRSDL